MTRATLSGLVLLGLVVFGAAAAPWLAPNPAAEHHSDLGFAPPMPPRILHEGRLTWPFVYPLVVENRLERQFAEDEARPARLDPFARRRLLSTTETTWLPLGGDPFGRDVFARLLEGGRLSLGVAGVAVLLTLGVGAFAGAVAGFAGGAVDRVISALADFVIVLPVLYAIVTMRAALPSVLETATVFWVVVLLLAALTWPLPARGVRAIVLVESRKPYAEAAYAAGATPLRILLRHVLPAARGHLASQGLLLFPAFVFAEATLSFVGLGFADPSASWGVMLRDASRVSVMTEAPWLLAPAAAIVVTVVAIHLVASGVAREGAASSRSVPVKV